ncbi:hypothetical protein JW710_00560 [Candidatus Dojkabacteria bacterium]|nr:hypothetical protein [Candidatus Dojkabacteria bacterium]
MSDSKEEKTGSGERTSGANSEVWDSLTRKVVVIVMIGFILVLFSVAFILWKKKSYIEERNNSYYAVFLTNGQVYFGHLFYENSLNPVLKDIYYLQSNIQGEDENTSYSLVKLGNELHGPEDMMYINRDHVLFWEELSDDSKVVSAIEDYEVGGESLTVPSDTAKPYVEDEEQDSDKDESSIESGDKIEPVTE